MATTTTVRYGRILVAVGALLASACGGSGDDETAEATTTSETTTTTVPGVQAETQMVDIGNGEELYLECHGEGTPTILLESGDEDDEGHWWQIDTDLGQETRTCAYDRLGNGRSSVASGCRGLDDIIEDTEALLDGAELEPPYIFVGSSGGGYLAAEMADRHQDETVGLVLVESPKAITIMTPELEAALKCDAPANIEHRDYYAVEHAVWDDRHAIGDFPVVIFSNDHGEFAEGDQVTNVEDQKGWSVLSPDFEQVVVDSGHDVVYNEPDLVLEKILEVLEYARA